MSLVCSMCGKEPSGRFYGDRCAQCRTMQTKSPALDLVKYGPGDRVLVCKWVAGRRASFTDLGVVLPRNSGGRVRPKLLVRVDGTDRYVDHDSVQLAYRPGCPVTDEMVPGIAWLLRERTQTEVATMLGMPMSTMTDVARRMRRGA